MTMDFGADLGSTLTALTGPVLSLIRAGAAVDDAGVTSASDTIENDLGAAWTETAVLFGSVLAYGSAQSGWAKDPRIEPKILPTAENVGDAWSGQRTVIPEIFAGILRRLVSELPAYDPNGLVSDRSWSIHAGLLLGYQTTRWPDIDRWRLVIGGFDHLGVFAPDGTPLFVGISYPGNQGQG